jgi:hypothetical protein
MVLTQVEVESILKDVPPSSEIMVTYHAGGKTTPRAVSTAAVEGHPRRWYVGRLERVFRNKAGELCFCMFTNTRYDIQNPKADGNYRTINPSKGELLGLEILSLPYPSVDPEIES